MAEQYRQYENDYRNGRRYEPARGEEPWRSSRDDDRDDRYASGGGRDRWSTSERESSYGRGDDDRPEYSGQDRQQFSGRRYDQERQSGPWRDESPEFGPRRGSSMGAWYASDRDREDWSARGEGGLRSSEHYGAGSSYGNRQASSGLRAGWGSRGDSFRSEGMIGQQGDWRSQGSGGRVSQDYNQQGFSGTDSFARGGENYGRGGEMGGSIPRQSHAGKGPKNYKRSDERIQEEVSDRLTEDAMIDAGEISVQVKDGEVTLSGTVTSREEKRRAEDVVERCGGVKEVTNNIRVQRQDQHHEGGQEAGSRQQSGSGQQSGSSSAAGTGSGKTGRQ